MALKLNMVLCEKRNATTRCWVRGANSIFCKIDLLYFDRDS